MVSLIPFPRLGLPLAASILSLAAMASPRETVTAATVPLATLHAFSAHRDGTQPDGGLLLASDGNLYGTAAKGGTTAGDGTVFRITPAGVLATLHRFTGSDGATPEAGLVQAADGSLLGTASAGGASGNGVIFRIAADGTFSVVHSFEGSDGSAPTARLIVASDGDFYGTTERGGANGQGVVFRMTRAGKLDVLHSFDGADGEGPVGGVIQASDGDLYGTTEIGGGTNLFYGTVFKLTRAGVMTTLHQFQGQDGRDGANPMAGLVQAADGNFYGTTLNGGVPDDGTVFSMTPAGDVKILHAFTFKGGGITPYAGLVQGADGLLYGGTVSNTDGGQIFSITTSGAYSVVHDFVAATEGLFPQSTLIQGPDGTLLGTTSGNGGAAPQSGTVYSLRPAAD